MTEHARHGVAKDAFEVIVRQALAGAPWQEICAGPMTMHGITVEEVEAEVLRRGGSSQRRDQKANSGILAFIDGALCACAAMYALQKGVAPTTVILALLVFGLLQVLFLRLIKNLKLSKS